MPKSFFVAGIGTEVGKTVASAILVQALAADYWKPVQSGDLDWSDSMKIRAWTDNRRGTIHPETFRLHTPMSPHAAAAIDGVRITLEQFLPPATANHLIVEGAGGLLVPLNDLHYIIDLIEQLGLPVILVSRHYLGSINHTLLSIEALQRRDISIAALVFNGTPHPTTEEAVLQYASKCRVLRFPELKTIDQVSILDAAARLRPQIISTLNP